jgi:hypothetical protein
MLKIPPTFQPTLFEPQGINNYPGTTFRCFTKGDTLPFQFTLTDNAGAPIDISEYRLFVALSNMQIKTGQSLINQVLVEVEIPAVDVVNGVFAGTVPDSETISLPDGLGYAMARYVNGLGESFIIDMCMLEIYPSISPTVY